MNFDNFIALKLPYINDNTNNSNEGNGSQLSTKSLAYCTPNPVPNLPENNQVHFLEYRGAHLAAFTVNGRDLICLPQAFELFLKHLVGGLHTVYTKLKRLEIIPVVCNVEQVRILRGLGAIQPGVNRCKLIAPQEFDVLYGDCTNSSSRPGRPSKRLAGVETPVLSSILGTCHSNNFLEDDLNESSPKQSRSCSTEMDGSCNGQTRDNHIPWINSHPNLSAYPLMNSLGFIPPLLFKSKFLEHLQSIYSSFMKYTLSNNQSKSECERSSSGSIDSKLIRDGRKGENSISQFMDLQWTPPNNTGKIDDQHLVAGLFRENIQNSLKQPKEWRNYHQSSDSQRIFDSKLQYFLNQFIEMNYPLKSNHHSSTLSGNLNDSPIKQQRSNSDHVNHRVYSSLNMNAMESSVHPLSNQVTSTNVSENTFTQPAKTVLLSKHTTDHYKSEEESHYRLPISETFIPYDSVVGMKSNQQESLSFSIEKIKNDAYGDNEVNTTTCEKNNHNFSFDSKKKDTGVVTNKTSNSNNDNDINEVNWTTSNTDISKTLAVLNYYYWWLQYMSNGISHSKQSTNYAMENSTCTNVSSKDCFTNKCHAQILLKFQN
ncbi:unnamed protein product [Heterobilharzia americana]|nr:unnamed protein product [Heterobilharzia americana]